MRRREGQVGGGVGRPDAGQSMKVAQVQRGPYFPVSAPHLKAANSQGASRTEGAGVGGRTALGSPQHTATTGVRDTPDKAQLTHEGGSKPAEASAPVPWTQRPSHLLASLELPIGWDPLSLASPSPTPVQATPTTCLE